MTGAAMETGRRAAITHSMAASASAVVSRLSWGLTEQRPIVAATITLRYMRDVSCLVRVGAFGLLLALSFGVSLASAADVSTLKPGEALVLLPAAAHRSEDSRQWVGLPHVEHVCRANPCQAMPAASRSRDTQCKGRTRCPQPQPHSHTQLFVPLEQNSRATFALTSARRRKAHPTFCSKWNAIILILICNAWRETAVMRRTHGWRWPLSAARDARS